ncbi:glutamate racemase [Acetobacteraceae bacterium KSS8]|uniref:Glutamate racemase n=1 Tax=Endosaccharibacter trunci TaxID=2812733 RepID=A0ABT1W8G4_9PROT|nr:glutamate racemase [Acetobacteraceae bacterium KSS8]
MTEAAAPDAETTTGRVLAFDSGIGGLSIVGALRAQAPNVRIDYVADNAVFPYGELADDVLIARVEAVLEAAIARSRPDVVVIACNTASTVALAAMRERFAVPFVGCVPPIKWAASLSQTRTIGLLATRATVRRPYLRDLQERFAADCTLLAHGARGLADIAERVFRGHEPDETAIRHELEGLFGQPGGDRIDVVGIGCTHYSVLLPTLQGLSPRAMTWLDPAGAVARQTANLLKGGDVLTDADLAVPERAWVTALPSEPHLLTRKIAAYGYPDTTLMPIKLHSVQEHLWIT